MADNVPVLHRDAAIAADCSLLVPMQLQALPVPEDADPDSWADLSPRYDVLDAETPRTLGRDLRPDPFEDRSEPLLKPGIHLHWTLPAAFTHIEQKKGEKADFPAVPNRWLVVRLWEETPGALRYLAQIVKSDYLARNGTSPWLTFDRIAGEFHAGDKIGRAVALDRYTEQSSEFELAAFAPGNLAFASFYPSCRNVFGFYDRQSDDQQKKYSYFVVGWFSEPAKEPLNECKDKSDWLRRMGKLGWTVPENTKALPTRILCHAAIDGVSWPPQEADKVGGFPRFELAVGGAAIDAIAALLSRRTAPQAGLRDRLLGQLQFALLQDRLPTPDEVTSGSLKERRQLTVLRSKLHEKAFTALPGGTRWEIDQPSRNGAQPPQQNPPVVKLPPPLAKCLSDLNRKQRDYDLKQRGLAALQREIYFQWYKMRLLEQRTTTLEEQERQRRIGILTQRIDDARPELNQLNDDLKQLGSDVKRIANDIRDAFEAIPAWNGHVLVSRPMPRYWRANDPTLLLAGVNIPTIQGGQSPLICRVTGQTVSSFHPQTAEFGAFDVQVDDFKGENVVKEFFSKLPASMPPGVAELLCEALLLDPQRVRLLARLAHRKNPPPPSVTIENLAGPLRDRLARRSRGDFTISNQRASDLGATTAFDAALSATALERSPFKPIFVIWEARYTPVTRQAGLEPWRLDTDGVDYAPGQDALLQAQDAVVYWGYAPLGDSVGRGLQTKTKREIDEYTRAHMVVQSLGGFTEALLMHDATIQLPPLKENSRTIDEDKKQLVGDHYAVAPLAERLDKDQFFPIRGGHLVINKLWVVNTFGRVRRVVDPVKGAAPSICISHSLAVAGSPQHIRLAPRLAQPARLLFRWLSAENDAQEFLGDSATQPICGLVIYNRLDRSLLICDTAGRPLGAVQSVLHPEGHDRRGIRWAKRPLEPIEPGDIPNPHLRGFVGGLLGLADAKTGKCTTRAFEDFLDLIRRIEDTEPRQAQRQALSVLMGRPLALVRASLRLDLFGPPAVDQGWGQLDAAATASAGFTETPFEVRLGNRRKGPDGLIGYFPTDKDGLTHYELIRLAQNLDELVPGDKTGHQYFRVNQAERVTCNPNAPAARLSLLLDPHLGVHISSGILPTKVIDLPAELVADALSQLELPFLVAPVLGERQPDSIPNIPLPSDMPGNWLWTWRPGPDSEAKCAPLSPETAPARSLFKTMALYEGWLALRPNGTEQR
jgi:hypothetical protein